MDLDEGGSESEDENQYQDLLREIGKLRKVRRQHHAENVRIAIASLIVGSYFTEVAQSLDPIGSVWYTDLMIVVAAGFLLAKLIALAARDMGLSSLERLTGSAIAPLVFTISILGYGFLLVAQFVPIRITVGTPVVIAFLAVLVVMGVAVSLLTYWRVTTGYSMYTVDSQEPIATVERVFRMISEFPIVVEPGLEIHGRERFTSADFGVDFIGEDSKGRSVAIEVKWMANSNVQFSSNKFPDQMETLTQKFDRVILTTNVPLNEDLLDKLEEHGIEHKVIDEFQVFGRLSELARWLDNRTNLLSRVAGN